VGFSLSLATELAQRIARRQLSGRRFREDLCLEAAEAIEARLGLATPIDRVR
jgi:hypothetical protein